MAKAILRGKVDGTRGKGTKNSILGNPGVTHYIDEVQRKGYTWVTEDEKRDDSKAIIKDWTVPFLASSAHKGHLKTDQNGEK